MKRIWSILIVVILVLSFTQEVNARGGRGGFYHGGGGGYYHGGGGFYHGWGGGYGWRGGYGYGYRPYIAPVPVPGPYYRPYYGPPAPAYRGRWAQPYYRPMPYGNRYIPGPYAR